MNMGRRVLFHLTVALIKESSVTGGTEHAARETMALSRYLCAKGCQDVRFSAAETFVPGP